MTTAPSATRRAAETSSKKLTCPGVSITLMRNDFAWLLGRIMDIGVDLMLSSLARSIGCVSVYLIYNKIEGSNYKGGKK